MCDRDASKANHFACDVVHGSSHPAGNEPFENGLSRSPWLAHPAVLIPRWCVEYRKSDRAHGECRYKLIVQILQTHPGISPRRISNMMCLTVSAIESHIEARCSVSHAPSLCMLVTHGREAHSVVRPCFRAPSKVQARVRCWPSPAQACSAWRRCPAGTEVLVVSRGADCASPAPCINCSRMSFL